jgi:hypothetical protein
MKRFVYCICLVVCASGNFARAVSTQPTGAALDRVRTALVLSPKDKLLASSLHDGTDPAEQNGFYRVMRIVSELPALSEEELRRFDSPAWANLLREPDRYRLQPIRWTLRVYVVRKRTVGKGLRANPYWPDDKPMYEIHATQEGSDDEPVILYAAAPPTDLPTPGETLADGRMRYKTGPTFLAAGVFLQWYTEASTDGAKRKYPVILAWQFEPIKGAFGSFFGPIPKKEQLYMWGASSLVLIVAVGMFLFVRRRLRRPTAAQRGVEFRKYQPLRDEEPAETKVENDEFVDPDLSAAVEGYQRDHTDKKNSE